MLRKLIAVFILAFILNWAWEIAHSVLYARYQGGIITFFILFRAALVDAGIILTLVLIAQKFTINKSLAGIIGGVVAAIAIEIWALQTDRWAYNSFMPIIPIIKIGLTPTIQLAITGYISQKVIFKYADTNNKKFDLL